MNAFNRLAMATVALLGLALAVGALLALAGVVTSGDLGGEGAVAVAARDLGASVGGARIVAFVVAGLVALLTLVLLWLELLPPRRRRTPFLVADTKLGRLSVEREGVCRLAEKTAEELHEVTACRFVMEDSEGDAEGIVARCVATVIAGCTVKDVATTVQERVREVVESQVGLKISGVEVRVRIGTAEPPPPPRTVE